MATLASGSKPATELSGPKFSEHSQECVKNQTLKTGDAVGCPVCQMSADRSSAATPVIEYKGGQRLYFCCGGCVKEFEGNHDAYINFHKNC